MAKNLAKVTSACNAKTASEGQDFQTPWVIYNPNSTNFKVLYSVHGSLNDQNEYYGDEFDGCGGGGSGSGSGGNRYKVTATYRPEEQRSIAPCQILYSTSSIESMKVDGVEEEVVTSYAFSSVEEHTIEFTLTTDDIGDDTFSGCTRLINATIGSGVTSIGASAFENCTSLTSIDIPNSVTSIGNYAFYSCSNLATIEIPDGVTVIGDYAFAGCQYLDRIVIPDSVASIGNGAFSGCSNLSNITINMTNPPTLGENVFTDASNVTIYVPCESVDTYESSENWSSWEGNIEGIPPCGGGGSGSGSGGGDGGSDEEEPVEEGE